MAKRPILNREAMRKMRRHAVTALAVLMVSQNVMVSFAAIPQTTINAEKETEEAVETETQKSDEEIPDDNDEKKTESDLMDVEEKADQTQGEDVKPDKKFR